uniref:Uncharacterized protein n=1 Tax=Rhizophora mucronata TaxID=61149 RepID=A0A2P2PNH4_RHIMU
MKPQSAKQTRYCAIFFMLACRFKMKSCSGIKRQQEDKFKQEENAIPMDIIYG